jgi:hypothetical protein
MSLPLDEAAGDLEFAVRAYNRGIVDASDQLGTASTGTVHQNRESPPAWDYVWREARDAVFADALFIFIQLERRGHEPTAGGRDHGIS